MDKNSSGRKAHKAGGGGGKEKSKSLFPWISFNRLYNQKTGKKKKKKKKKSLQKIIFFKQGQAICMV